MESRIDAGTAQRLSSPNPFALITSTDGKKTNVMALSWWTYCSNHPMTVAICLSQRGYSGKCIAGNGQFCLSLPGEKLADAAFAAGTCSGANVDKVEKLGIALAPASTVEPPYVAESRLALECKVQQSLPVGDHAMFIAEVTAMHTDPEVKNLMALDGYGRLAVVDTER